MHSPRRVVGTPLCAAAPTAGCYDYPVLLTRRRQVMHSPRRLRRGDAALRRGSNGGSLRLPGTGDERERLLNKEPGPSWGK
jgi:hypothetical protein